MVVKVCLDAGHYGKYNCSPANSNYYESDMVWKLHLYLKEQLEMYGINVITTRDDQKNDRELYERGLSSKGCNLFISLHSNAVGSSVNEKIDYPVSYVLLNGKSDDIGLKLAKVVEKVIGTKQPGKIANRRGNNGEYYGVLRGANAVGAPAIILEHSFHTNSEITNWLLKDGNLKKLAQAEAECIASHYGLKKIEGDSPGSDNNDKEEAKFKPYLVEVTINNLNIRTGPGTNYNTNGKYTGKGAFTIIEEAKGTGASKWGLLKSYSDRKDGWISLDYTKRI
ncbi:N-acetylmuramoyl-L-alanine amidase [Clostridium polynesiense]|uniref:N-acetylmuramoyl-L-alanine amidase n=1 Tax=Clostridium polynesiense TaxID=1325933 RepID=UPI000694E999